MDICDSMDRWSQPGNGYGDRLADVRDWVKEESDEWGIDKPSVQVGAVPDEDGNRHYAGYDPETNTITIDPELLREPDLHPPDEVYNSVAHEMGHAMQHQYYVDDIDEEMDKDERERDADDFADAYSDYWDDQCNDSDDAESVPGNDFGDWNLPEEINA